MSTYGDNLRKERRSELAMRTLSDMINEYGEVSFATKTEGGQAFPAAAYAYVPDSNMPSTWKLRLWATPNGGPDAGIVGAAIAALGKGFRGNKVSIPEGDLPAVKAKVKAAWIKANPDKDPKKDMPAVIASGEEVTLEQEEFILACGYGEDLELSVKVNDISQTPDPSIGAAVATLINAAKTTYADYKVRCDIDVEVSGDESGSLELYIDKDGISQTPTDIIKMAFDGIVSASKDSYGTKVNVEVKVDIDSMDDMPSEAPVMAKPSYGYSEEDVQEMGTLPPALKAQLVKKLTALLAKEKDPVKKAAIMAKIKAYS